MDEDPQAVLDFWFGPDLDDPARLAERSKTWFTADPAFDDQVRDRFAPLLDRAAEGALDRWREHPRDSLALVLVLDQFPRNLHRGSARAFAHDAAALAVAEAGMRRGLDRELHPIERTFYYMPMQHSEDPDVQARSVAVFEALAAGAPDHLREDLESNAGYAREHRDIVARFGRFPHRNPALGRTHSAAEREWLEAGGTTFGQAPEEA